MAEASSVNANTRLNASSEAIQSWGAVSATVHVTTTATSAANPAESIATRMAPRIFSDTTTTACRVWAPPERVPEDCTLG